MTKNLIVNVFAVHFYNQQQKDFLPTILSITPKLKILLATI